MYTDIFPVFYYILLYVYLLYRRYYILIMYDTIYCWINILILAIGKTWVSAIRCQFQAVCRAYYLLICWCILLHLHIYLQGQLFHIFLLQHRLADQSQPHFQSITVLWLSYTIRISLFFIIFINSILMCKHLNSQYGQTIAIRH